MWTECTGFRWIWWNAETCIHSRLPFCKSERNFVWRRIFKRIWQAKEMAQPCLHEHELQRPSQPHSSPGAAEIQRWNGVVAAKLKQLTFFNLPRGSSWWYGSTSVCQHEFTMVPWCLPSVLAHGDWLLSQLRTLCAQLTLASAACRAASTSWIWSNRIWLFDIVFMCFLQRARLGGMKVFEIFELHKNHKNKTREQRCVDASMHCCSPPALTKRSFSSAASWRDRWSKQNVKKRIWACLTLWSKDSKRNQNLTIKCSKHLYVYIYIYTYIMFSVQTGCDVSQIWRRILTAVVRLWLGCAHWDPAWIRCALMHADADTQTDSDVLKAHKNIYLVYTNSMHSHMLKSIEKLSLFGGANRFTCFGVLSRRNWTLPWWSSLRLFWPHFIQPKM